jgi:hypothetical protein
VVGLVIILPVLVQGLPSSWQNANPHYRPSRHPLTRDRSLLQLYSRMTEAHPHASV